MDQQTQAAWREVLHCVMCQCQINSYLQWDGHLARPTEEKVEEKMYRQRRVRIKKPNVSLACRVSCNNLLTN